MEPTSTQASAARTALAAAVPVLPFVAALATGDTYYFWNLYLIPLVAPALAAVMIRVVGSWRRWAWVGAAVTLATITWGTITWLALNAGCQEATPVLPSLTLGASVLLGALVGARVVAPTGSAWRAAAGAAVGLVLTALLAGAATFLLVGAGIPTLLAFASHC